MRQNKSKAIYILVVNIIPLPNSKSTGKPISQDQRFCPTPLPKDQAPTEERKVFNSDKQ